MRTHVIKIAKIPEMRVLYSNARSIPIMALSALLLKEAIIYAYAHAAILYSPFSH